MGSKKQGTAGRIAELLGKGKLSFRPKEPVKPLTHTGFALVCLVMFVLLTVFTKGVFLVLFVLISPVLIFVLVLTWMNGRIWEAREAARASWLRPRVIEVPHSSQAVFSKIREVLWESVYNRGDKWKVTTPDVQTNRIFAEMRLHGKDKDEEGYISMEARMEDLESGHSVLRLVFDERCENWDEDGPTMQIIKRTEARLKVALENIIE